ncbi:hypothetical protein MAQ5080_00912 [Marinomonas aquimarina]|uniref:Retention module-containing protein n=1 Tax=Marinomonas aquimarina TaxID=295068 RepID=A0A1A8T5S7_9GAMM|nr:retention module-containing protein [Marinomonas aquimarina]SBS27740.1 hypothetical protein MAQ5080_00912 [Marinomonas aquimarina]
MSDNQTIQSLGEPVGFVSQLQGAVRAHSVDGQERILQIGQPIYQGDIIFAAVDASATLAFTDGTDVYLAEASAVEINDEVYRLSQEAVEAIPSTEFLADGIVDLTALQQAILAGQDPTQVQDAPAAGEGPLAAGLGGVLVDINRSGLSASPTYGYDTQALNTESITLTEDQTLLDLNEADPTQEPDPETPTIPEPEPDSPDPEDPDPEDPDPEDPDPEDPDPEDPDPEDPDPEEPDPEDPDPEDPESLDSAPDSYRVEEGEHNDGDAQSGLDVSAAQGVLANDEQVTGLKVTSLSLSNDGSTASVSVSNGEFNIATNLGGTLTVKEDGSFTYKAPNSLDHSDVASGYVYDGKDIVDSVFYKSSDGSRETDWTKLAINIVDQGVTGVNDNGVAGVQGNVLSNDTHIDNLSAVTSVIYDSTSHSFADGKDTLEILTGSGTLTIEKDGDYSFAVTTLTGASAPSYGTGFKAIGFGHGNSLSTDDTGAFFSTTKVRWDSEDEGINVNHTGGTGNPKLGVGTNSLIDWNGTASETLLVKLETAATAVVFGVHNMNGIDQSQILAFDTAGDSISVTVTPNFNSGNKIESVSIASDNTAIGYVSFANSQDNRNNDGFTVQEIQSITPSVNESFTYHFEDIDGSQGSAELQISSSSGASSLLQYEGTIQRTALISEEEAMDDYLIGGLNSDTLTGGERDDTLFGGNDIESDLLIGGEGADTFILNEQSVDRIEDFTASEDKLDVSDLLDLPLDTDSSNLQAVQEFLDSKVEVSQDGSGVSYVKIDGQDIATFGSGSQLDSNVDGTVGTDDRFTVIFNDQEYTINIDG